MLPVFKRAKSRMIKEFDDNLITQEIEGGINADNISNTLSGGMGNLFSFIGFEENPINDLRDFLDDSTLLEPTIRRGNIFYFRIYYPGKNALKESTPMPWEEGLSWTSEIEKGMSNLSHFLYVKGYGRSGGGFQSEYQIEDITFTPPNDGYLTPILQKFRENIEKKLI
jgi:hypothetical protein